MSSNTKDKPFNHLELWTSLEEIIKKSSLLPRLKEDKTTSLGCKKCLHHSTTNTGLIELTNYYAKLKVKLKHGVIQK